MDVITENQFVNSQNIVDKRPLTPYTFHRYIIIKRATF
jgi:hypothetical protein